MSGALATQASNMLGQLNLGTVGPRHVGKLAAFDGLMLEATGLQLPVGACARTFTCTAIRSPD